ncbi:MAG: hypothetical protein MUF73_03645 [Rhodobacteraceae bacterium]|jgi:hypothetical protein|nr:hypothetical protein [Paracoccaceae bacterium]
MPDDPRPSHSVGAAGGALVLAALVALMLNPGTPLAWAFDAPLPAWAAFPAMDAAAWVEETGLALGLDRPGQAVRDLVARMSGG